MPRYIIAFYILIFTLGFGLGILLQSDLKIELSFSDFVNLATDICLALFVTYFIGDKLNKNSKLLDLKLELYNNFDHLIEEIHSEYKLANSNSIPRYDKLLTLFTRLFHLRKMVKSTLINFDAKLEILRELEVKTDKFWSLILDPISKSTIYTGHDFEEKEIIETLYSELKMTIFQLKISIYT